MHCLRAVMIRMHEQCIIFFFLIQLPFSLFFLEEDYNMITNLVDHFNDKRMAPNPIKVSQLEEDVKSETIEVLAEQRNEAKRETHARKCKKTRRSESPKKKVVRRSELEYFEDHGVDEETYNLMKSGKKPVMCNNCHGMLSSTRHLILHWNRGICEKFGLRSHLFAEKIIDCGTTKYVCAHPDCEEEYKLLTHRQAVESHWNEDHKEYAAEKYGLACCEQCDKSFVTQSLLNTHVYSVHMREKHRVFSCNLCGYKTFKRARFEEHENMHKGLYLKCEYCSLKFHGQPTLTQHQKLKHPKEIGFVLKQHICEECGKSFPTAGGLKEHKTSHADKPNPDFQCKICLKFLKQKNSYQKHLMNVHNIGHRCKICNNIYFNEHMLIVHVRKAHGIL